jgi:hypothetical protein
MCHLVKKNYNKDIFWDIYEKNLLIMTNFVTQVDFSTQIKSYSNTEGTLSGSANINQYVVIGTDYSDLPLGLDLTTTGITSSYGPNIYGTFSGTTGSTTFYFDDSNMDIANPYLSAITSSNSGITQNVSAFDVLTTVVEDGNSFDIYFSGVSFDVIPLNLDEYSPGLFSGVSYTYVLNYLSGTTYPWWFLKSGSTTWNEIKGRTKTDRLTVVDGAVNGYILTSDNDGNATWQPNGGGSFSGGSGNCITDLYVTNIHGCSPITIHDSIQSIGSSVSSTTLSIAFGSNNVTNTDYTIVLGGKDNLIGLSSDRSSIIGGDTNAVNDISINSSILGGISGLIKSGVSSSVIIGGGDKGGGSTGDGSIIESSTFNSVILGGYEHIISSGVTNSIIVGGINNVISPNITNSIILGGSFITAISNDTVYVPDLVINKSAPTPTTSGDTIGEVGSTTWDDNYFYIKTNTGWGRINLDYSF